MTRITIPVFKPRWYQIAPMQALDSGVRNVLLKWGRRSGKDVLCLNYMAKRMVQEVGVYFYILPTYAQGKKVIWDSITNDGFKMIDYIPKPFRVSENSQEMKITLSNGSIFQVIGSQNYDSLMGTNPRGIVFSEHALSEPKAYEYIRPILGANPNSWQIIVSTPRGHNSFYDLYTYAKNSPQWFCDDKTSLETGVIDDEFIEQERARGVSEELIQQEYYCSFTRGIEGSYYGKLVDKASRDGRIGNVPWDPNTKVHTAWDLGVRDSTSIIFYQKCSQEVHIVDYYEAQGEGMNHYANVLRRKADEGNWIYGHHHAPHDIQVRELSSGALTRKDVARSLGIDFDIVPNIPLLDGIECGRGIFHRIWIDEQKCNYLIRCLEGYHKAFNDKLNIYSDRPVHNEFSHCADAFRYLAISERQESVRDGGLSPEEWKNIRQVNLL